MTTNECVSHSYSLMYDCLTSISTLCCILTLPIRSVSLALSVFSASPFVGLSRSLSLSLSLSRSPSACASSTLDIDALPSSQWYAAAWSAKKDFFPVDDPAWSGWDTWTRFRVDPVDWAATPALLVEHDDAQIKQRHLDGEFILGGLSDHVLPQYATVPNAKAVMIDVENGSLSAGLMYMRVALAAHAQCVASMTQWEYVLRPAVRSPSQKRCTDQAEQWRCERAYWDAVQAADESAARFTTTGAQEVKDTFGLPGKPRSCLGGVRDEPRHSLLQRCSDTFATLMELKDVLPTHEDDTITDARVLDLLKDPCLSQLTRAFHPSWIEGAPLTWEDTWKSDVRMHDNMDMTEFIKDETSMERGSESDTEAGKILAQRDCAVTPTSPPKTPVRGLGDARTRAASVTSALVLDMSKKGKAAKEAGGSASRFAPSLGKGKNKSDAQVVAAGTGRKSKRPKVSATHSSTHSQNEHMMLVCTAANCDMSDCDNRLEPWLVAPKKVHWIAENHGFPAPLGLVTTAPVADGTWVSSFGELVWNPTTARVAASGYSLRFFIPTALGQKACWGTPKTNWFKKHTGGYINHTCCLACRNCEWYPDDNASTFNVVTTRDLLAGEECLVNYFSGEAAPYSRLFEECFETLCTCCACTRKTPNCCSLSGAA